MRDAAIPLAPDMPPLATAPRGPRCPPRFFYSLPPLICTLHTPATLSLLIHGFALEWREDGMPQQSAWRRAVVEPGGRVMLQRVGCSWRARAGKQASSAGRALPLTAADQLCGGPFAPQHCRLARSDRPRGRAGGKRCRQERLQLPPIAGAGAWLSVAIAGHARAQRQAPGKGSRRRDCGVRHGGLLPLASVQLARSAPPGHCTFVHSPIPAAASSV